MFLHYSNSEVCMGCPQTSCEIYDTQWPWSVQATVFICTSATESSYRMAYALSKWLVLHCAVDFITVTLRPELEIDLYLRARNGLKQTW